MILLNKDYLSTLEESLLDYIAEVKTISKNRKRIIYIVVNTNKHIDKLCEILLVKYLSTKLNLLIIDKYTRNEYIVKISFLSNISLGYTKI